MHRLVDVLKLLWKQRSTERARGSHCQVPGLTATMPNGSTETGNGKKAQIKRLGG